MNVPEAEGVPLMVIVFDAQCAVTPAGNPVGVPIPVAPPVVMVIEGESAVFIHRVGVLDGGVADIFAFTVIVPVANTVGPHPPVTGILYENVPETVGVPLMVMVFAAQVADTPAGKPVGEPMPVAPVVVWVIGVNAEFIHTGSIEDGPVTVILGVTVIVPVALTDPQPPVSGIE